MTTYLHLVFSEPPSGLPEADFNEWYDAHVKEILAVDGWVAATRYRLEPVVRADGVVTHRFLSLYELDVSPDVAVRNLAAAGMGNADSYVAKKDAPGAASDPLPLPDWFPLIGFASFNAVRIGERILPD